MFWQQTFQKAYDLILVFLFDFETCSDADISNFVRALYHNQKRCKEIKRLFYSSVLHQTY